MNPILLSPKIESDKSIPEQLQQIRSYLFQFKEQIELLFMNIDSDNVSEKFKDDFSEIVNSKIMNGNQMSQILQSAGQIRLSVENLGNTVTSLSLTVDGIEGEVSDLDGNVSSLSLTVNGLTNTVSSLNGTVSSLSNTVDGLDSTVSSINGEVSRISNAVSGIAATYISKNGSYNGVTINDNGINCSGDGSFIVDMSNFKVYSNGTIKVTGGQIGAFDVGYGGLMYGGRYALWGSQDLCLGDSGYVIETWIWGKQVRLQSNGGYIILGSNGNASFSNGITCAGLTVNGTDLSGASWETITYLDDRGQYQTITVLTG